MPVKGELGAIFGLDQVGSSAVDGGDGVSVGDVDFIRGDADDGAVDSVEAADGGDIRCRCRCGSGARAR